MDWRGWVFVIIFVTALAYQLWWERDHPCSKEPDPIACEEERAELREDSPDLYR